MNRCKPCVLNRIEFSVDTPRDCTVCGKQCILPPFLHGKSRMRKRARTDLRGGRSAMVVPTATIEPFAGRLAAQLTSCPGPRQKEEGNGCPSPLSFGEAACQGSVVVSSQ